MHFLGKLYIVNNLTLMKIKTFHSLKLTGLLVLYSPFAAAFSPTASGGYNQIVKEGSTVTLDSSGSTHPKNAPLKFTWNQVGGQDVALTDLSRVKTSFQAPNQTNNVPLLLTFEVTAEDNEGHSDTDSLRVMVIHENKPPCAEIDSPVSIDSFK